MKNLIKYIKRNIRKVEIVNYAVRKDENSLSAHSVINSAGKGSLYAMPCDMGMDGVPCIGNYIPDEPYRECVKSSNTGWCIPDVPND